MKNSIKSLKNYFQMIMMAVTCFVMGFVKDKEYVCENGSEKRKVRRTGLLSRMWRRLGMSFVWETPKAKLITEYIVKDTGSKNSKTNLRSGERKNSRKNKIIYWNEPKIQNRINRAVYFNTG